MLISGRMTAAARKTSTSASTIHRSRMRVRRSGAIPVAGSLMSLHQVKSSAPARLIEEVQNDVPDKSHAIGDCGLVVLVFGRHERPVNEERSAYDVLAGHEAPVAAIEAVRAVVAHDEVAAVGNNEVTVLDVVGEIERPLSSHIAERRRRDGGEIVTIVVRLGGDLHLRLVLGNAIEVDGAVDQVDVVAGDADDALDEVEVLAVGLERGLEEDDDVAAAHIAIVNERRP